MKRYRCHYPVYAIFFGLGLALVMAASPARAVRPGEVSWTAEAVTAMRAIAAMDPDEKIRCSDDLAIKFVTPAFWHYSPYKPDYETSKQVIKAWHVGTYYLVNARTKHTDDTLVALAGKGLRQVVVLGAGFDTRAYRFADKYPQLRFYEMDLPATITSKQKMAKAVLDKIPSSLLYVAIDFNTQNILDTLKKAGYQEDLLTLFIWEGVTYYITESAVEGTLRLVAEHSAPGSTIIFDYVMADVTRDDFSKYKDGRFVSFRCALAGEPWIFGFEEGQAPAFVEKCGLQVVSDMGPREMVQNYLIRSDGQPDGQPSSFFRLMHAAVPPKQLGSGAR